MTDLPFEITAVDVVGLWSVQASRDHSLDDFTDALFTDADKNASLASGDGRSLLRAWPHQVYLLTDEAHLPIATAPFAAQMTDIADAFCAFDFDDEAAFDFIADYLSADIRQIGSGHHCLRCRLGHYTVLLWWQNRERLHCLVERSLAQSFENYVRHLMTRRSIDRTEFNRQPARVTA